jgi:hypothetical protein
MALSTLLIEKSLITKAMIMSYVKGKKDKIC